MKDDKADNIDNISNLKTEEIMADNKNNKSSGQEPPNMVEEGDPGITSYDEHVIPSEVDEEENAYFESLNENMFNQSQSSPYVEASAQQDSLTVEDDISVSNSEEQPEPASVVEPEPQSEPAPVPEHHPESEPESVHQTEPESVPEPQPVSEPDSVHQPEPESVPETNPVSDPESAYQPEPVNEDAVDTVVNEMTDYTAVSEKDKELMDQVTKNLNDFTPEDLTSMDDIENLQRVSLYLKELENSKKEYDFFMTLFVEKNKGMLSPEISSEKNSIEVVKKLLESLMAEEFTQKAVETVNQRIKSTDVTQDLIDAEFGSNDVSQIIDDERLKESLAIGKLYSRDILKEEPSKFVEGLKSAKGSILAVLNNPNVKVGLSSLAFAGALASGGALPLVFGGVRLIDNLANHDAVKNIFGELKERIIAAGDKVGIDARPVTGFFGKSVSFVKSVANSKAFKALALIGVGVGVGSVFSDDITSFTTAEFEKLNIDDTNLVSGDADSIDGKDSELNTSTDGGDDSLGAESTGTVSVSVTSEDGSLWKAVENHYSNSQNIDLTDRQIMAVINDLGLDNPNNFSPGDKVDLPIDIEEYKDPNLKVEYQDWHGGKNSSISTPNEPFSTDTVVLPDVNSSINGNQIADAYKNALLDFAKQDLEGFASANSDFIESTRGKDAETILGMIEPGMEFEDGNGGTFSLPELEDVVATLTYPDGVPPFLDKEALVEAFNQSNPNVDFDSAHWMDIIGVTGNHDVLEDSYNQDFNAVSANESFSITNTEFNVKHNYNGTNSYYLKEDILESMYDGKIPELLDRDAVIDELASNNPELRDILNSHSKDDRGFVNLDIIVPDSLKDSLGMTGTHSIVNESGKVTEQVATSRGVINASYLEELSSTQTKSPTMGK